MLQETLTEQTLTSGMPSIRLLCLVVNRLFRLDSAPLPSRLHTSQGSPMDLKHVRVASLVARLAPALQHTVSLAWSIGIQAVVTRGLHRAREEFTTIINSHGEGALSGKNTAIN